MVSTRISKTCRDGALRGSEPLCLNGAQKQKQKSFFVFVFGNRDIYGPKTKIQVDPIFAGPQKSKISTKTSSIFGEFFSTNTKTKTVLTFSS